MYCTCVCTYAGCEAVDIHSHACMHDGVHMFIFRHFVLADILTRKARVLTTGNQVKIAATPAISHQPPIPSSPETEKRRGY